MSDPAAPPPKQPAGSPLRSVDPAFVAVLASCAVALLAVFAVYLR
jgi:hypothetical protein